MAKNILAPEILTAEPDAVAEATLDAAAGTLVAEARAATQVLSNAELDEIASINQMTGMLIFGQGMEVTNKLAKLRVLEQLKKAKNYKNVPIKNTEGKIVRPKNFEELCAAFGTSRAAVDRDLENIAAFGEGVLLAQKTLGIGYRELRALRGSLDELPDAKKAQVKELIADAAQSNDKEVILAALDELGARNAKLSSERDEALAEADAQKKVQSKTAKWANDLEIRLEQALNPANEDEVQKKLAAARGALLEQLDYDCRAAVGLVATLCNHVSNVRKADTERPSESEPIIDVDLWEHITTRIAMVFDSMHGLALSAGLDARPPAYADAGYDGSIPQPENDAQQ